MASFAGKFNSIRQDWETPTELFDIINKEFCFTWDCAADAENSKVPGGRHFSETMDAMVHPWKGVCWLNPPYGKGYKLSEWVKKAHKESTMGATVVMLIPARTNTNWFHD